MFSQGLRNIVGRWFRTSKTPTIRQTAPPLLTVRGDGTTQQAESEGVRRKAPKLITVDASPEKWTAESAERKTCQ